MTRKNMLKEKYVMYDIPNSFMLSVVPIFGTIFCQSSFFFIKKNLRFTDVLDDLLQLRHLLIYNTLSLINIFIPYLFTVKFTVIVNYIKCFVNAK